MSAGRLITDRRPIKGLVMDANAQRTINDIRDSVRDIHRDLLLLGGYACSDGQVGAISVCQQALSELENGEIFEIRKSFEG